MSHYQRDRKPKLITHTGSHKKVMINMEIAKESLDKQQLKKLNDMLVELNDIQEKINKTPGS